MYFHQLRPEIITITIRWYGLAYLAGFLIGYKILQKLSDEGILLVPRAKLLDFLTALAVFGVMLGGRLGYFVFYQTETLFRDPAQLLFVWEGGMASHGGMIGCALFLIWWARKYRVSFWSLTDSLCIAATPGIALGRLANFINGELWGRVTTVPWGVVFPLERGEFHPGGTLAARRYDLGFLQYLVDQGILHVRHPSQIYQALGEGLLLFLFLWFLRNHRWTRALRGRVTMLFLGGYGLARFVVEFFRAPDPGARTFFGWMSTGQLLTLFMFALILFVRFAPGRDTADMSPDT